MLSTAVALNLEGAPLPLQEDVANDGIAGAVLGGMNLRHIRSTSLAAGSENASGVPSNAGHACASTNSAALPMASPGRNASLPPLPAAGRRRTGKAQEAA